MDIWDRLGDVIDETGAGFGAAFTAVGNGVGALHDAAGMTADLALAGARIAGGVLNTAYSYALARPVGTFGQAISYDPSGRGSDGVFNFLSPKTWAQMDDFWNATGKDAQDPEGNPIEGISPGQAVSGSLTGVDFSLTPAGAAERNHVFNHTWYGKLLSGSIDLTFNIVGDPVVAGAKVVKFAGDAANTAKNPEELAKVIDYAKGGAEAAGKRVQKLGDRFNRTVDELSELSPAEAASHPLIRDADTSGALSYTIARALDEPDQALRKERLRDVLGAAMGDSASMDRLHKRADGLEDQLRGLAEAPPQTRYEDAFSWDDNGQGAWSAFEATGNRIFTKRERQLQEEADRLRAAADAHMRRVQADPFARARWSTEVAGLRQSVIPSGFTGTPARVISGLASPRLPGHVNIKDSTVGFDQLKATFKAAKFTSGDTARKYLDQWVKATSVAQRRLIAGKAEAQIVKDYAEAYGMSSKTAQEVYKRALAAKGIVYNGLAARVYSAATGAKLAHVFDPETGELVVWDKPIAKSQLEDHHLVIDPRMLGKFLAKDTNRRGLEEFAAAMGSRASLGNPLVAESYRKFGSAAANTTEWAWNTFGEIPMLFMKLWKDQALMRLAYPVRVQVDTQGRLAAWAGASQYALTALSAGKVLARHALSARDREGLSPKNLFKGADLEDTLRNFMAKEFEHRGVRYSAVADEEDMQRLISRLAPGAGIADLQNEISNLGLLKLRSTGDWGEVASDSPDWLVNYDRAIKRQIMGSPTMRQAVIQPDRDAMKAWVANTPEGRAEWRELAPLYDHDIDAWLDRVQAHVDDYLPEGAPRQWAASQIAETDGPKWKDVQAFFDNRHNRMTIHGESFAPAGKKSPFWDWYENKVRNNWYHVASELPEVIMGRAPLYRMAYQRYMNEQIDRLADDAVITDAQLLAFRKNADKMARREVGKRLFDTSHSSTLAHHMRLISPFFSAWEDTMKKWSGLLYDKPWLAERGKQLWEAPNDVGLVVDDEGFTVDADGRHIDPKTGQEVPAELRGEGEYIIAPKSILRGDDLRIRKGSFNIVFQGEPWWLPGVGPLVQVPVNELAKKAFAEEVENPILRKILPFGIDTDSPAEQLMPSWYDAAWDAFHQNKPDFQQQASLVMKEEMTRWALGERDTQPTETEVLNKARNRFLFKFFASSTLPVSVDSVTGRKLQFYVDQARYYQRTLGDGWRDQFFRDFPGADAMAIELSANETGITAGEKAWDAQQRFKKAIAANEGLGWAFVGPANDPSQPWNQGVYAAQRTQPLGYGNSGTSRTVKGPADMLSDIEVNRGWIAYTQARQQMNLALEQMGLTSLRQAGAEQLNERWKAYVQQLRDYNPRWSADYDTRDSGKVRNLVYAMEQFAKDYPSEAGRDDVQALNAYVQTRKQLRAVLAARPRKSLDDPSNADLATAWDGYVQQLIQYSPGFEQMYSRVLEADGLTEDL